MEKDMSKYTGTTSAVDKNYRSKFMVNFHVEFLKSLPVAALNKEEAQEIAKQRILQKQKGMLLSGYHLGDIELISVEDRE
jgi:capsule polysaccharide export protein KpsE/RkpR